MLFQPHVQGVLQSGVQVREVFFEASNQWRLSLAHRLWVFTFRLPGGPLVQEPPGSHAQAVCGSNSTLIQPGWRLSNAL